MLFEYAPPASSFGRFTLISFGLFAMLHSSAFISLIAQIFARKMTLQKNI
jgi:hypothetical protein